MKIKVQGIGFTWLLTLLFITLKLCKVITWSWWWVLAPVWISAGLALILIVGAFILYVLVHK